MNIEFFSPADNQFTLAEWNRLRVEQYAKRTNQTLTEARYYLHRLFTEKMDYAPVDAVVDPVVDELYQSHNRPTS